MRRFALIGKSLRHSFSHKYFRKKFNDENINDCKYINIEIDSIQKIKKVIKEYNLDGFNITIPYKQEIIPLIDKISKTSRETNSVNVVKIVDGKLYGFNTDIIGFKESIRPLLKGRRNALVLGNGGSSQSIQYVLKNLNIKFQVVSRNSNFDYTDISKDIISKTEIIINCTPIGMYPDNSYPIIPYNYLNMKHLLFDLVYNPKETQFLTFGKNKLSEIKNGHEMLKIQAEESWNIWNSNKFCKFGIH